VEHFLALLLGLVGQYILDCDMAPRWESCRDEGRPWLLIRPRRWVLEMYFSPKASNVWPCFQVSYVRGLLGTAMIMRPIGLILVWIQSHTSRFSSWKDIRLL
jgi:hypothetical protein